MKNLLVVDFDYFFPDHNGAPGPHPDWSLYDWGHAESLFYIHHAWPHRAASFLSAGLPLPMLTGEQETFWSRFRFSKNARLYYDESNVMALHRLVTLGHPKNVWLYDAHHDCGYGEIDKARVFRTLKEGKYECGNWMLWYWGTGANLHIRYPAWKHWAMRVEDDPSGWLRFNQPDRQVDDGLPNDVVFNRVFLCRSGAWVPSWLDHEFEHFVNRAPFKHKQCLSGPALTPRGFSMVDARLYAQQISRAKEEAMAASRRS